MKMHADPKPLEGPFTGGSQGATVSVELLTAGEVRMPKAYFEAPEGASRLKVIRSEKIYVPCPAFLVHHPTAGPILVDTGLHPSISTDPKQNFGRLAAWYAKPRLEPGMDVPGQLRARGLEARNIGIVIMTHLHVDHASGISEFPNSTFVLTAAEWKAATDDPKVRHGYRPEHYDYIFDYRTIDFAGPGVESYSSFGRTFDLLGDGSIRLAHTPGHSSGHMSVILRLGKRDFVIAGDAIYTYRQLEGGPAPFEMADRHWWKRSLQELQIYHRDYPHALIVPGHDAAYWAKLEPKYED